MNGKDVGFLNQVGFKENTSQAEQSHTQDFLLSFPLISPYELKSHIIQIGDKVVSSPKYATVNSQTHPCHHAPNKLVTKYNFPKCIMK